MEDLNPVVLTGDFNIDNLSSQTGNLMTFMSEFNLKYLPTDSTTDYGSALDHIYTNISDAQIQSWGTLESYFSDHKPLYIALKFMTKKLVYVMQCLKKEVLSPM